MSTESEIIRQHERRLFGLACSFRRSGVPLEDLRQEAALGALTAIRAHDPTHESACSVSSFIYRAAQRRLMNTRRSQRLAQRFATVSFDDPIGESATLHDVFGGPEPYDAVESRHDAQRLLDTLPKRHREVVTAYMHGRDVRSIAGAIGVSKSRVDQMYSEALRIMAASAERGRGCRRQVVRR